MKENDKKLIKVGDIMKASPVITNTNKWVEGIVIDVEQNPFRGLVIAIKDKSGRIFYGEEKYFSFS